MRKKLPVFFHHEQLLHAPLYEYAFGEKIHHPETTHRAQSILKSLEAEKEKFDIREPTDFPIAEISSIHNKKMVQAIKAATTLAPDKTFYPCVFPYHRNKTRLDPNNIHHAGAFCFDNGTPLNATTYSAAAWSAADACRAAEIVVERQALTSYALCRPPGHHASVDLFGGYCYFNNAALAAKKLNTVYKKIALIDIDFHHGNGTQVIFESDPSVLFISLHGDPNKYYPYFTGFSSEIGNGAGKGFNLNIPLETGTNGQEYRRHLNSRVIKAVKDFAADALVISAGFDTYIADPIGKFTLETEDYQRIGEDIATLKLPCVVIQEGGYEEIALGRNVAHFLYPFL